MSTRWYPIYQRGNPQLRIFLPNFWMKLVKPQHKGPDNVVNFACSMEMTRHDVKQYLEKIYAVKVEAVYTRVQLGKFKRCPGRNYIIKEDDTKLAYVTLPRDEKFVFPDIFPDKKEKEEDADRSLDETKAGFREYLNKNKDRPGLPSWFTV